MCELEKVWEISTIFRCEICSALDKMKEQSKTTGDLQLAQSLKATHVARYSDGRLEIERQGFMFLLLS